MLHFPLPNPSSVFKMFCSPPPFKCSILARKCEEERNCLGGEDSIYCFSFLFLLPRDPSIYTYVQVFVLLREGVLTTSSKFLSFFDFCSALLLYSVCSSPSMCLVVRYIFILLFCLFLSFHLVLYVELWTHHRGELSHSLYTLACAVCTDTSLWRRCLFFSVESPCATSYYRRII